jgi:hypothetical protein
MYFTISTNAWFDVMKRNAMEYCFYNLEFFYDEVSYEKNEIAGHFRSHVGAHVLLKMNCIIGSYRKQLFEVVNMLLFFLS